MKITKILSFTALSLLGGALQAQEKSLATLVNEKDVFLVDVRSEKEFDQGSALNAVNIPVDKIELLAEVYHVTPAYIMGWEQPEEDVDDSPSYYDDPEVAAIANEMKENPNIRVLFDASRGLSKESIEEVRRFVEYQKAKERGDYDY